MPDFDNISVSLSLLQKIKSTLYIKQSLVCNVGIYVRFTSSETIGRANIKLGTIDHLVGVSMMRGRMTSSWRQIQRKFFYLHSLTEKNDFFAQAKASPRLTKISFQLDLKSGHS